MKPKTSILPLMQEIIMTMLMVIKTDDNDDNDGNDNYDNQDVVD